MNNLSLSAHRIILVALDLSKAFDTVANHTILKDILDFQISTTTKRWMATRNDKCNNLLKNLKPGDKKFWSISKQLRGKSNKFTAKLKVDNLILITPEEKASALADHFQRSHELTSHMRNSIDDKVEKQSQSLIELNDFLLKHQF
ncbi:hypothetical protein ACFFRR_003406 [Megaselia abdita]